MAVTSLSESNALVLLGRISNKETKGTAFRTMALFGMEETSGLCCLVLLGGSDLWDDVDVSYLRNEIVRL